MREPSVIVALTDAEIADFFPGEMWGEFQRLVPNHRRFSVPPADPGEWAGLWRKGPGEVLVCAWQAPSLNGSIRAEELAPLRYICYLAGSVRKLVPRELIERGMLVTNWGSSISATVAECTLMLTLMALRRAAHWSVAMHRDGAWKDSTTTTQSLLGRRVGIHGLGAISRCLVPMLRPFTDRIQVYSPHVPMEFFSELGVERCDSLEELFSSSDVVIELAALTPENFHIVDERILRLIPPGGVFVNVGRGAVVDEAALARVAAEGKIQVALDVYEVEPLPKDSPLRGMENVTLLPHLGGPTRDRRRDSGMLALRNLRAFVEGKPLEALVSLEVYDRST